MAMIQYVFRRGSVYWWRRRLPLGTEFCASIRIEFSLHTKEPSIARIVAVEVTRASERLLLEMNHTMISKDDARRMLMQVALKHTENLDSFAVRDGASDPDARRRRDLSTGWAYRLLAAQGDHAKIGAEEEREMRAEGLDDATIGQVESSLQFFKTSGFGRPHRKQLEKLLETNGIPIVEPYIRAAETLYLRGMASAHLNTERRASAIRSDDLLLLQSALSDPSMAEPKPQASSRYPIHVPRWKPPVQKIGVPSDQGAMEAGEQLVEANPMLVAVVPSQLNPSISSVTCTPESADESALEHPPSDQQSFLEILRSAADEKVLLEDWKPDIARQHLSVAKLFARYLGHDNPAAIRQSDIAGYRSLLFKLPKTHGKSPSDHLLPLSELINKAQGLPAEQVGMAPATINRYMTQINNLAEICRAFGAPFGDFDGVARLRSRKKGNARDDRAGFATEELETLLGLPVWHGCASGDDRFAAGGLVFHDSTYWVPLLAIYTGARREEICGLLASDVEKAAEKPFIRIEENKLRGVKNPQSKRRVPLHPELIRLGFLDYVTAIINAGHDVLFPDLLTETGATPMGDVFDDQWQKMRALALPLAKDEGKVLHSLRHWCNDAMKQKLVSSEIRRDILGHGTGDMNEGRYANPSMIAVMSTALSALPLVSRNIQAHPIQLTSRVIEHRLRPTKKRKGAG